MKALMKRLLPESALAWLRGCESDMKLRRETLHQMKPREVPVERFCVADEGGSKQMQDRQESAGGSENLLQPVASRPRDFLKQDRRGRLLSMGRVL